MSYKSSIQSNKNALFGGASSLSSTKSSSSASRPARNQSSSTTSAVQKPNSSGYNYSSTKSATSGKIKCFLTADQKMKKEKEASEWRTKAKTAMKSSFFSRPDPLEAYGYYKKAAECYKSLCKPREEALMWETAGGCSMTLEHFSSAAGELKLAGACWVVEEEEVKAAKAYEKSAEAWSLENDFSRAGEMLMMGGIALCNADSDDIGKEYLRKAVSFMVPDHYNEFKEFRGGKPPDEGTEPPTMTGGKGTFTGEHLWKIAKIFLAANELRDALYVFGAMTRYFLDDGVSTVSLFQCFLAVSCVQLAMGDVVAAEKTYMEVHLQVDSYLTTDYCKVAEGLVMGVKEFNGEKVEEMKKERIVGIIDGEVRRILTGVQTSGIMEGAKVKKEKRVVQKEVTVAKEGEKPKAALGDGVTNLVDINDEVGDDLDLGLDDLDLDGMEDDIKEMERMSAQLGEGGDDDEDDDDDNEDDEIDLR